MLVPARNFTTASPKRTMSPSSSLRRTTASSFTKVPLVEPRSSIHQSSPLRRKRACRRDTESMSKWRSRSVRLPTVCSARESVWRRPGFAPAGCRTTRIASPTLVFPVFTPAGSRIGPVNVVSSSLFTLRAPAPWGKIAPGVAMIGDRRRKASLGLAILSICAQLSAGEPDPRTGDHIIERSRTAMGTYVHITIWGNDDEKAAVAMDEAFGEFDRIDRMMTTWTDTSEVSHINQTAGTGKPVPISAELVSVLEKSAEASRLSHGAFDITVGSFSGVWKFDEDNDGTIPPSELVAQRKKLVNWRDLVLDPAHRTARLKKKGQKITLGGIAKGYSVDKAVAILRNHGLVDFIVQAGGDMYCAGKRGDRRWRVGIRDPRGPRDSYFALAEVEDRTFSTSGDYERFVIKDGKRYHHIIDPATGYPASGVRSVTIMAKDGITAEGLSKIVFIWGAERGMKLIESLPDVDAVVVDAQNHVTVSKGLKDKLTIVAPPTDGT